MKMIYLINPPDEWAQKKGDRPPLGLAYLSAYLKKFGHITKVFDLNHANISEREVLDDKPNFVCITVPTPSYNRAVYIANTIKNFKNRYPRIFSHKLKLVAGGNHVAAYPNEKKTVETYDFIVAGHGDGEQALLDIVEGRAKEQIVKAPFTQNLDDFPYPDYEALSMEKYNMLIDGVRGITMSTGRGCIYSCFYCGSSTIKKVRNHSPEYVIGHMKMLYDKYGIRGFYFVDDIFTNNFNRVYKICELIKVNFPQKDIKIRVTTRSNLLTQDLCMIMKEAGVDIISIGLESGSDKVLKAMQKVETVEVQRRGVEFCYNAGIKVKGFFIIGNPQETWEDVLMTINFAKDLVQKGMLHYADCYILNPVPASQFWQNPEKFGIEAVKPKESNWNDYYQIGKDKDIKININHPFLSHEQLKEGIRLFYEETKSIKGLTY